MEGLSVAVIGGGPGGVLAAAHFAKLGARVTVFERRTVEEQNAAALGWSIALGDVAMNAIEAAGLSTDLGPSCKAEGFAVKVGLKPPAFNGAWSKKPGSSRIPWLLTRTSIIRHIKSEVEAIYGSMVTFKDGHSVAGGNLCEGELLVEAVGPAGGSVSQDEEQRIHADLVVIADGAASRARGMLATQDPSFKYTRTPSAVATLVFALPPGDARDFEKLPTPSGERMQIVPPEHKEPLKGGWVWFGRPVKGASDGLTLLIVNSHNAGKQMAASVTAFGHWWKIKRSEADVMKLLEAAFPHLPTLWLQEASKAVATADDMGGFRTSSFVHCNKLGSGRCVLLGDAAHAVSPNIGAGATNAMADAMELAKCAASLLSSASDAAGTLREKKQRLSGLEKAWTAARLKDAHAVTSISEKMNTMNLVRSMASAWAAVQAAPVAVPAVMSMMPTFPGKSFVRPPQMRDMLMNGPETPAEIERALYAAFYRAVALAGVAVAVFTAVAVKAAMASRSWNAM